MHSEKIRNALFVIGEVVKILIIVPILAYLFFNSRLGLIVIMPYGIFLAWQIKAKYKSYMKNKYLFQFKDALSCLLTALEAGYSIERATVSAKRDMKIMYGEDSCMAIELEQMERKLSLGQSIEAVFEEFAEKTGVKEIISFSDMFSVAKRSGGDIIGLIRAAVRDIYEKMETQREIESIISANRTECLIMKIMPPAIILYFKMFSSVFLEPLYETAIGRVAMLVLAGVYFIMCEYSRIIVEKAGGE